MYVIFLILEIDAKKDNALKVKKIDDVCSVLLFGCVFFLFHNWIIDHMTSQYLTLYPLHY